MRKILGRSLTAVFILAASTNTNALSLQGTIFEHAARDVGLDPKLLYAVALAESARGQRRNYLGPHPWTLRSDEKVIYAKSRDEAEQELIRHVEKFGTSSLIDVGLMQINLRWHGKKVSNPTELLDPRTNIQIAAQYLAKMIKATPADLELGIGKYHVGPVTNETNLSRARNYGSRVIAIYRNLVSLGGGRQ